VPRNPIPLPSTIKRKSVWVLRVPRELGRVSVRVQKWLVKDKCAASASLSQGGITSGIVVRIRASCVRSVTSFRLTLVSTINKIRPRYRCRYYIRAPRAACERNVCFVFEKVLNFEK